MRRLAALALLALAACEGGDPVESALRETAAANHAAATRETDLEAAGPAGADAALLRRLIAAEREALAAAEALLAGADDPETRALAETAREHHRDSLQRLERLQGA